ncbi:MAG: type I glyceraldehyde-3-phosphate dehydrogenase [Candidatus Yanofskybacteria bacterium RIFCSPLOWO2_12_FULL_43_11b]|uniref:Type I glyceraldehyde-3-phosphate dehydrogenase n=1 Tax=Candidatus Yanofskybacteria bacterium RIFCSPLOWO2_12_FULL_43_11b TaxID=1802710 RepID=A0A1F8H6U3_9BACT|nr:MAG: type I glyceraldehyde-3-phosphate dehydrogenase [Candidatus Yanofskybacteria bacterium RIFCSPHIGHO2_01_FULL_43_32]OGN12145.1 MAG: type I glyceraldehyde-3-phosphate dehydrogenase [Candidatus Yanofskybacteria bacterium RIFCSPHIGHO2_02_FULL_43_12]OGN18246.1 MAG: type I glyceraldehyde-3-phosphate dehydrogenase [Candidatus Yanofskybacteria bacterium RIFCSPHIGHO2_12_FULL_43_11]OGN25207.1 MAG: type I glyceraldehyde-3-phosphate dehydrogenase [Candidatus Yanofskybacteria bacterium RIFCSPLOWO2_01_
MAKIAINGFGRIGRAFFKLAITKPELEVVAINDLGNLENLAYLLKYDSAYGRFERDISAANGKLIVDGKEYQFLQEKDATKLPWGQLGVDIVVEATGAFESYEKASVHKQAGAKRVVITAPAKDDDSADAKTVLMGVNEEDLKTCSISSNGSCTTNSVSPLVEIISEKLGIKKAFLNTVHGYTAKQSLIDGPTKDSDYRRGRAAAVNISPSTTGAAIAVARAVESLRSKFDGIALRVPVQTGSISAISFISERPTTVEEINLILKAAESEPRWQGIFKTTTDQLVSTDIVGDSYAAIADLSLTKVVDGDLCCVYSWYDNEFGYTNSLVEHVLKVATVL